MPTRQRHRGPHPQDQKLFAPDAVPRLQEATRDLSWLYTRGYNNKSAATLVGDHFQLPLRQRTAVQRAACAEGDRQARAVKCLDPEQLAGRPLNVDGYNILITAESALSGGVLLRCADGCIRDMASIHGSYRRVVETTDAIGRIGSALQALGAGPVRWYLDAPVSGSGRLCKLLLDAAEQHGWPWTAELHPDPDRLLAVSYDAAITADSAVLDRVPCWYNLAADIIGQIDRPWLIDLSGETNRKNT